MSCSFQELLISTVPNEVAVQCLHIPFGNVIKILVRFLVRFLLRTHMTSQLRFLQHLSKFIQDFTERMTKGYRSKHQLSKPLSTFINSFDKPNFCFHLSHRRSTTVSLETRNPFTKMYHLLHTIVTTHYCNYTKSNVAYLQQHQGCALRKFSGGL